jgi:hypothetical protein
MENLTPDPITSVIKAIVSLAATPVKNQLERNERVIKILQSVELNPDHPPQDFTGVYRYTLVKYGVDKPVAFVELFRQELIVKAFRQAFEQNNPLIAIKETENFIDDAIKNIFPNALTPMLNVDFLRVLLAFDIEKLNIDIPKEFNDFKKIFVEVANSTRVPSDVIRDQKITELEVFLAPIYSILVENAEQEWNKLIFFKSERKLVTFEITSGSNSLGVTIDDGRRQKINLSQNFRLSYQIPFNGHSLLVEETKSGWEFVPFCSDKDEISDEKIRYIQERLTAFSKGNWVVPTGQYPFVEESVLGLHRFVLLLSSAPFPSIIEEMIAQELTKLSSLAFRTLVEYCKENASTIKLILAECDIVP